MIKFNLDSAEAAALASAGGVSVLGLGGAGTNVIDKMALEGMAGVDLVSLNCDARALQGSMAGTKLQLGRTLTQGLGCGGDPELGAEAGQASREELVAVLAGRRMVFLCVGLGGGTGSGAAPLIARLAREAGAFVVVFATLPFSFEGRRRSLQAGLALRELEKSAHALVTFENDRMGELVVPKKGVQEAFELADRIIGQSVRAVAQLVTQPGLIRIGMDDLLAALRNADSRCLFGYGQAKGANRAAEALAKALKSPLLDRGQMLAGARNVLVHICGGASLTLFEMEALMRDLGRHIHAEAQILFGAGIDPKLQDFLSVTILTSLGQAVAVEPVAEVTMEPVAEVVAVAPPVVAAKAAGEVALPGRAEIAAEVAEVVAEEAAEKAEQAEEVAGVAAQIVEVELFAPLEGVARGETEGAAEVAVEKAVVYVEESAAAPALVVAGAAPAAEWEGAAESEVVESEIVESEAEEVLAAPEISEEVLGGEQSAWGEGKSIGLSELVKREVKAMPVPAVPVPVVEVEEVVPVRPVAVASRTPNFDSLEPIRPIAAGKRSSAAASPFAEAKAPAAARPLPTEQQTFDERLTAGASGGRFDRVTPTVEEGEDLDVPTFLRRKR